MPMRDSTVVEFSGVVGVAVERLCGLLAEAGVRADAQTVLEREDKARLLLFLRRRRGNEDMEIEPSRIALRRRKHDELRVNVGGTNRGPRNVPPRQRTVIIEELRTRNYIRRHVLQEQEQEQQPDAEQPPPLALEPEPVVEAPPVAEPAAVPPEAAPAAPERAATPPPEGEAQQKLHVSPERAARRRKKKRIKSVATQTDKQHTFQKPVAPMVHEVEVPESISVSELAQRMSVKSQDVLRHLMGYGTMVTINQVLDQETARVVVDDMGHRAVLVKASSLEEEIGRAHQTVASSDDAVSRPAVVTVMGHVDHGKTTLLDRIRASSTAAAESGGITQHIGAYVTDTPQGRMTFLDTPGHEAFTAMRARGAKLTDLVVLVVAADDGVMPQTREAIQHAKAANVPVVVAVNKIDKPDAQPERIRQELASAGLTPEEWGGESIYVDVSAQTGDGIEQLLEALHLQAELLELRAHAEGSVSGVVIESRIDRARGAVATVLVQNGRLNKGDVLLSGSEYGKVRAMLNQDGTDMEYAGPSTPVEVIGLSSAPAVGASVMTMPDERTARDLAERARVQARDQALLHRRRTRGDMFAQVDAGAPGKLHIIVKADVQGTVQALAAALENLQQGDAGVLLVSQGIGGINESDVNLAKTCQGLLLGFNVRADSAARRLAEEEGLQIRYYNIIYELLDDVRQILSGMATPEEREQVLGMAEVREVFHSPKFGDIAGCMVVNGQVRRNASIRVLRDDVVVYEGQLESLRRFKEDIAEVKVGVECGIGVKNYSDVRVGDRIEVFERVVQQPGS